MALFEVAIYNELVKRAMQSGEPAAYSDDWADTRYIEVSARDEMDARRKVLAKYPKDKGFVIRGIGPA
ncbi:conserved hypothetical protein [Candidatus Terasakiella magnetica]|uniref:Uncharacterized protein n=1 Tax=Candidatus Terasakiella magnetica TaxID=1867952 RepID=A0A1C3RD69_9PROT|nr:hypothetical protein [Candidatus Terasakiella magnetica]SCA55227.1 conserved hypothetical protein [Candidatus Terasakiella magnetica]